MADSNGKRKEVAEGLHASVIYLMFGTVREREREVSRNFTKRERKTKGYQQEEGRKEEDLLNADAKWNVN